VGGSRSSWKYRVKGHIPIYLFSWVPPVVFGAGLAGLDAVEPLRFALLLAAAYLAMRFQHAYHTVTGKTSTPPEAAAEERAIGFAMVGLAVAAYLAILEPESLLILPFVVVGLVAYSHIHREEVLVVGYSAFPAYVCEVVGELTAGRLLASAAFGCMCAALIVAYRVATGDYDHLPPGFPRRLKFLFAMFTLTCILFAFAFTVGI